MNALTVQNLQKENRETVDAFFSALETENFDVLKDIFAENAKQLNPYVPKGFSKIIDG